MRRVNATIEILGGDEWSEDYVVSQKYDVSVDGEDQSEALAYAIGRLLTAVGVPRKYSLLAAVVINAVHDDPFNTQEESFCKKAEAVIDFWNKSDEELDKLMEKKCPNPS
jgi:hypothetical protein